MVNWPSRPTGAPSTSARWPASRGILHLAEHGAGTGPRVAIDAPTILAAWRIGDYFKAATINAFIEMGTDQGTADARYLLQRIERLGQGEVSERDLHVASSRARFKTKRDLRPALDRLIDHGYLIPLPAPEPTGGRPASPRYRIHPVIAKPHNTQKAAHDGLL